MTSQGLPRIVQSAVALGALGALAPVLLGAAVAVKKSSEGPIFFKQTRMGKNGQPFTMYKFRTMRVAAAGHHVTASGDSRITTVGRILRRTKLDELPELWNVVRGDMALVGPRPEVPSYVSMNDPDWQRVLSVPPGLTDPVTLELRNEESLLAEAAQAGNEVDAFYRNVLLPYKLKRYQSYFDERTWLFDIQTLVRTAVAVIRPSTVKGPELETLLREKPQHGASNVPHIDA